MIAYCGLNCETCDIYKATVIDREDYKDELASRFSTPEFVITVEDISCKGCLTKQQLFKYCTECDIRACAASKNTENCGVCDDYPCDRLNKAFEMDPSNRVRLNEYRRQSEF